MTLTCLSVQDCTSPAPFHLHSSQVCGLPPEDFLVFSDTEPGKIHFLGSPICPSSKPKVIVNFLQDHKSLLQIINIIIIIIITTLLVDILVQRNMSHLHDCR